MATDECVRLMEEPKKSQGIHFSQILNTLLRWSFRIIISAYVLQTLFLNILIHVSSNLALPVMSSNPSP